MSLMSHSDGDLVRIPQNAFLFKADFDRNIITDFLYAPHTLYGLIVDKIHNDYKICVEGQYWFINSESIYSTGA